ncbi:MAG: PhzF family phenazine biosynthesis protein [Bacteroidales bacterium]|nr:PhzF family phenazine biosynthesis protein [Bacteroidales bacterium]
MTKIPLYQVDAFTDKVFRGNPAAVCPLEIWPDERLMQLIGMENNLSETAFLVKNEDFYEIRWFTPKTEVDLCGHATLASAFVIFNFLEPQLDQVVFKTGKHGILRVFKTDGRITLDFPAMPASPAIIKKEITESLGKLPDELLKTNNLLAVYDSEDTIKSLSPDFNLMKKLEYHGVIVTAPGNNCDFVSRYFAPSVGINEDPVTGSAHTTLIPYWSERLGKDDLVAQQLSERKGQLFCKYLQNRVHISGNAVLFLKGEIQIGYKI